MRERPRAQVFEHRGCALPGLSEQQPLPGFGLGELADRRDLVELLELGGLCADPAMERGPAQHIRGSPAPVKSVRDDWGRVDEGACPRSIHFLARRIDEAEL